MIDHLLQLNLEKFFDFAFYIPYGIKFIIGAVLYDALSIDNNKCWRRVPELRTNLERIKNIIIFVKDEGICYSSPLGIVPEPVNGTQVLDGDDCNIFLWITQPDKTIYKRQLRFDAIVSGVLEKGQKDHFSLMILKGDWIVLNVLSRELGGLIPNVGTHRRTGVHGK